MWCTEPHYRLAVTEKGASMEVRKYNTLLGLGNPVAMPAAVFSGPISGFNCQQGKRGW
jgi:hypothetical protein